MMEIEYPTVDTQFLLKWSGKILDNYNMTQDKGIYAPLYELLKQMFEEAWVVVYEEEETELRQINRRQHDRNKTPYSISTRKAYRRNY